MASNVRDGISVSRVIETREFESLPRELRDIYYRAPFNYTVQDVARKWKQFSGNARDAAAVKTFRALLIGQMADRLQREAYITYGPDHPDARRHRITGRPLDNPPVWRGLK